MTHKLFSKLLLFISFIILLIGCKEHINNKNIKEFDETLSKHLKAIENRDLKLLLETVNRDKIVLILPNGKYSDSFDTYREVNQDWFSDLSWEISYTISDKIVNEKTGIVTLKINYINKETNQTELNYYLTLIFKRLNDGWKLVHDQNTIIKK